VISVVDPETRHAHKTTSVMRDGFKAHVVVEPDTGVVTALTLTAAAGEHSADGDVGALLIGEDPDIAANRVEQILADTAYCTLDMLNACEQAHAEPVIKPWPISPALPGGFTVDDFIVDPDAGTVTCPAGHVKRVPNGGQVKFTDCARCPLRGTCTTSATGRTFRVSPAHMVQRAHRARVIQAGQRFVTTYAHKRPLVERSLAWLFRHARRVPYRGVAKNKSWLTMRAAAINLKRLIGLGLIRHHGAWTLAPT